MSSPERKHKVLRIVTAGSIAALGVAGAAIGKTIIEELSKPKVSALEKQQPEGIAPSQKAFNELVTVTPSPSPESPATATPESPKTPTPEVMTNCSIIPQEYCNKAEIIPYTDSTGSYDLVVIDLPIDTILTAPATTDKFSTAIANPPFSGSWAGLANESGTVGITVIGNYRLLIDAPALTTIKAGTPFGVTTETDQKNPGGKGVAIRFSKRDPNTKKWFTPREEVEKYFPGIYSRITAQAINYDGPIKAVVTYHYSGGPQDPH